MLIFFKNTNNDIEVFNLEKILCINTKKTADNWRLCIYAGTNDIGNGNYIYFSINSQTEGNEIIQKILDAVKTKKKFVEIIINTINKK